MSVQKFIEKYYKNNIMKVEIDINELTNLKNELSRLKEENHRISMELWNTKSKVLRDTVNYVDLSLFFIFKKLGIKLNDFSQNFDYYYNLGLFCNFIKKEREKGNIIDIDTDTVIDEDIERKILESIEITSLDEHKTKKIKIVLKETRNFLIDITPSKLSGDKKLMKILEKCDKVLKL